MRVVQLVCPPDGLTGALRVHRMDFERLAGRSRSVVVEPSLSQMASRQGLANQSCLGLG
jgi:hypothetical protein